jgi:hypothetical protein
VNETERDREVDAAWRAVSREEPPPALDAAIRAQARRAIGTAPGGARRRYWSYPLAAAATVAALAIGIAQLTPPERVAPTLVAEQAVAPQQAANETSRQSAAADARSAASPAPAPAATVPAAPRAIPPPTTLAQKTPAESPSAAIGAVTRERAAAPTPQALAKKQLQAKEDVAARDKLAAAPAEKPAAAAAAGAPGVEERAPASPPRSEPFPASPAAADARRDAYAKTPKSESNGPTRMAAAQAPRSAGGPSPAPSSSGGVENESRIEAKVAAVDAAKTKDAAGRSVEDWIKRIRELRNAERFDDMTKELAAFRAAFGERADALLPADLRAMEPRPPK